MPGLTGAWIGFFPNTGSLRKSGPIYSALWDLPWLMPDFGVRVGCTPHSHPKIWRPPRQFLKNHLFLKWLVASFPEVPLLFIIRHPCAVVSSRMQLGWATDTDIAPFLAQPNLVDDFLADKMDVIERAKTVEEKHAIIWCISNLIPIRQFGLENLNIVYYEKLVCEPETEIDRIFRRLNLDYDKQTALNEVEKPSVTTTWEHASLTPQNKIGNWKAKLSSRQIDNILSLVHGFGLNDLYDHTRMPKMDDHK